MLNLWGQPLAGTCEGTNRREFMKVGALGLTGFSLPGLLRQRAVAAAEGRSVKDTSVVWVWLGGGATHIETFDPKMEAPSEFRSVVGSVSTSISGVKIGEVFPKMAQQANQMAFVRSFAHGNSGHGSGVHYVMTGADHPAVDAGVGPIKPSFGSIAARVRGTNHPQSGVPTYIRLSDCLPMERIGWEQPIARSMSAAKRGTT